MCVWYGKNYDGIVFDIWYVFTTLYMFLGVNLGCVTTLGVKMGLKMGWCDTFDILGCIRETDTTERFFVFDRKTSVCVAKTQIANWIIARCKAFLLDTIKTYHNTVLL